MDWMNAVLGGIAGALLGAVVTVVVLRRTILHEGHLAREASNQQRELAEAAINEQRLLAQQALDAQRQQAEESLAQQIALLRRSTALDRESTEIAASRDTAARLLSVALVAAGDIRHDTDSRGLRTLTIPIQALLMELSSRTSARTPQFGSWLVIQIGGFTNATNGKEHLEVIGAIVRRTQSWLRDPQELEAELGPILAARAAESPVA